MLELAADHPVRYDAWDLESWTASTRARSSAAESVDVVERPGRSSGSVRGAAVVRAVDGDGHATCCGPGRRGSTSTIDLDWHHDEHLLSLAFPLDVRAEHGHVRHPVRGACAGRRTRRRRGTPPSSRSAPTATSTSPSRRSASPCSTTAATATRLFDGARAGQPGPGGEVPRPRRRPRPPRGDAGAVPARAGPRRRRGRGRAPRPAAAGGRRRRAAPASCPRRSSRVTGRGVEVDAVKLADDGSGDLVVRLHEAAGDRTPVDGRRRPAGSPRPAGCNLLEEPQRSFEVVRRHRRPHAAPVRAGDAAPHAGW